jgi:KDO2-lipid IV(A) lauroyltransferase
MDNLLQAGVAATPREAARLARASFRHFAGHMLEKVKAPRFLTAENWREHVEVEAPAEKLELITRPEAPLILLTAHLGCWEIAGFWTALFRPVTVIAQPMKNPYVQRFLIEDQFRARVTVVPKSQGLSPELFRALKERHGALALVADQHAGRHGYWLRVFGRPASMHTSPARLHLLTGFPLIFGVFVRVGPLRYRVIMDAPLRVTPGADREADMRRILRELNARLEAMIRRYPGQYLWMHRRWRTPPAGVLVDG